MDYNYNSINYKKIVQELDKKYSEKWIEFILSIIETSNIDLINFLENPNLTLEIYNNIEFEIEDDKCYMTYKTHKKILTPFEVESVELINILSMYNPNFGKSQLIEFLDTMNKDEFIDIFNGNEFDIDWLEEIYDNVNLTFDILVTYAKKHNIRLNKTNYNFIGDGLLFWYYYNEHQNISIELLEEYIDFQWIWPIQIIYNKNINMEFIEKHKNIIKHSLSFCTHTKNDDILFEKLLSLCILCNINVSWKEKKQILEKYDFNKLNLSSSFIRYGYVFHLNILDTSKLITDHIELPYEIISDMIKNPISVHYSYFNNNIKFVDLIKHINLPNDLIKFCYNNYEYLLESTYIHEGKKNIFCDYNYLTPDIVNMYYFKYNFLNIYGRSAISWYQYNDILKNIDSNNIDFLINIDNIGKQLYYSNELYKHKKASIIQKAWRICRYNPKYTMCEKVQLRNLDNIQDEHNHYLIKD